MAAKKTRWRSPKMRTAVARYAPAFREVHDALTHQYREKLKSLESMSDSVITKLGLEQPPWFSPEYLKNAREQANLSQEELATSAGLSRSTIANWEAGDIAPSLDTIEKVATVLTSRGSALAAITLKALVEMDEEATREALQMIDKETVLLREQRQSLEAHLAECSAEHARLDQIVVEDFAKIGRGRGAGR